MADKNQQPTPAYSPQRATMVLWLSVAVMVLLFFSLPTVIVFAFGMLPSVGAYVIDQSKEKYATFCVAGLNFCGVFPYLMDLWFGNHTIYAATNIMADVFALFIMFGSAGIGWVIYSSFPPVISSFISVIAQQRVNSLRNQQKELVEEWGEMVIGNGTENSAKNATDKPEPASQPPQANANGAASNEAPESPSQEENDTDTPPQAAA